MPISLGPGEQFAAAPFCVRTPFVSYSAVHTPCRETTWPHRHRGLRYLRTLQTSTLSVLGCFDDCPTHHTLAVPDSGYARCLPAQCCTVCTVHGLASVHCAAATVTHRPRAVYASRGGHAPRGSVLGPDPDDRDFFFFFCLPPIPFPRGVVWVGRKVGTYLRWCGCLRLWCS